MKDNCVSFQIVPGQQLSYISCKVTI